MSLSEREKRAMKLAQQGYSVSGVAKEMDLTEGTIRKYFDKIEDTHGVEALCP